MAFSALFFTLINAGPLFIEGAYYTVVTTCTAMVIGIVGGLLGGLVTCKQLKNNYISPFVSFYVFIIRGTPVYVQVLIIYFVIPEIIGVSLSPCVAGVIALGCNSIAYVSEIVRGGLNTIPVGQWEACAVLGYSQVHAVKSIIVPQMFKNVLPSMVNELIVLLKETSILSMIGCVEITRVSMNISARTLDPVSSYGASALLYLTLTSILWVFTKKIEKEFTYDCSIKPNTYNK